MRNRYIAIFLSLLLVAMVGIAAKPGGIAHMTSLWIGDKTDTADTTPGGNDLFVSGTAEFDGLVRLDGGFTAASVTRDLRFDLGSATVDSGNDVDDGSAPNLTTVDNVPAIVWDDSSEVAGVQWGFRVPSDYSTGMTFYAIVSSDDASGAATKLDWGLVANTDDGGFGSVTAQDLVACTSATLDASNEVLTLTPDATGAALFVAGSWITVEVFNASTNDDDLELKGFSATYTATH